MIELKIRGYVTPEDFTGTDAEKLQQALNVAAEQDIRKVIVTGTYHADKPLTIPANMHLLLENAELHADITSVKNENYAMEQDRIFIQGISSKIVGDLEFFHTRHTILEDLEVEGNITMEFARDLRIENVTATGKLTLGRGCAHAITQHLTLGSALITSAGNWGYATGRNPQTRNILLRSSKVSGGVQIVSASDYGMLNIQVDQISADTTAVTVGVPGEALPKERYTNFSLMDLDAPEAVVLNNPCHNAHIAP